MRQGRPFALALADLDHFKRLNDTHGHEEGDRSLRLFSHVVRQVLRDDDLVARWGGEEFLIALPDADADAAVEVMDRIRANLARLARRRAGAVHRELRRHRLGGGDLAAGADPARRRRPLPLEVVRP